MVDDEFHYNIISIILIVATYIAIIINADACAGSAVELVLFDDTIVNVDDVQSILYSGGDGGRCWGVKCNRR